MGEQVSLFKASDRQLPANGQHSRVLDCQDVTLAEAPGASGSEPAQSQAICWF